MAMRNWYGNEGGMKRGLLDYLLRAEPGLRRHRDRVLVVIALMMTIIAAADVRRPGVSLAFGYSLPVALGAYALGIRAGVMLSVVAVVLRGVFAGRKYGEWWLYGGSVLMFAEYLLLAIGVGLLGRAVARLERQTRVLRQLNEFGRNLTALRDSDAIRRVGVEGAVRLTGAEGGCIATQEGAVWRAAAVFRRGQWSDNSVIWLPEMRLARNDARPLDNDGSSRLLDAPIQVDAPVTIPGGGPCQLVVFRAVHGPFTSATVDVLKLAALHMTTALHVATGLALSVSRDPPATRRGSGT